MNCIIHCVTILVGNNILSTFLSSAKVLKCNYHITSISNPQFFIIYFLKLATFLFSNRNLTSSKFTNGGQYINQWFILELPLKNSMFSYLASEVFIPFRFN